uniref:Uncharacterized protein n=1 Tax=Schistocephalus solidus TaxID=70667 RepID=A0A0V0J9Y7_SCHSO
MPSRSHWSSRNRSRSRSRDRHSRHHNHYRRRSPSSSLDSSQDIKIQLKPLVLASDNEKLRSQDIAEVESAGFVQTAFCSSRKTPQPLAPVSSGGLNTIRSSSSQYGQMVNEKAHEAAIFGTGSVDSLLSRDFGAAALGGRPNEARENLVSVLDTIKDIMHPRLKKCKETAYQEWAIRLKELQKARGLRNHTESSHTLTITPT